MEMGARAKLAAPSSAGALAAQRWKMLGVRPDPARAPGSPVACRTLPCVVAPRARAGEAGAGRPRWRNRAHPAAREDSSWTTLLGDGQAVVGPWFMSFRLPGQGDDQLSGGLWRACRALLGPAP